MDKFIIYNTDDGNASVRLYANDGTVWMTQAQIAELFQSSKQNISQHIKHCIADGEFEIDSVVKYLFTTASQFFAETQNKLIYGVTGKTAADLIMERANSQKPNMALTSWSGVVVRRKDIIIAKNYLSSDELDSLNRLVTIFLESAELRVKMHKDLTLEYWRNVVDKLLDDHGIPLLAHHGHHSHDEMKEFVSTVYDAFDTRRKREEACKADEDDLKELEKEVASITTHKK